MEASSVEGVQAHWLELVGIYTSLLSRIQFYKHLLSKLSAATDVHNSADTSQLDIETHEQLQDKFTRINEELSDEIQQESDAHKRLLDRLAAPSDDAELKELLSQAELLEPELEKCEVLENSEDQYKMRISDLHNQLGEWKMRIEQAEHLKEQHSLHKASSEAAEVNRKPTRALDDQIEKFLQQF